MFQRGEHVRQGGHGPIMAVRDSDEKETTCEWVDAEGALVEKTFPTAALIRYEHLSDAATEEMIEHRH